MDVKVPGNRLVVVSNRLPVIVSREEEGDWHVEAGSGGLVSAMTPVLRDRGGVWIGWPGSVVEEMEEGSDLEKVLEESFSDSVYDVKPVMLTASERDNFYYGFSNEVVWPLFHDFPSHCNFDPIYWRTYQRVNRKYASVISRVVRDDDFLWVHDYHLMEVAQGLREMGTAAKVGFFLHTPFPPPDIFFKLPWRSQILRGLLAHDLIGLQTPRDVRNFLQCARALIEGVHVSPREGPIREIHYGDRTLRIGAFPISIDFLKIEKEASGQDIEEKASYLRDDLLNRQVILGVDRLDYTKGIPNRLEAFRSALERYPDLHNRVTLIQVVVPSREDIPEYHELKTEIERLVGEINGQFTRPGWVPIHYMYRSLDFHELLAYYRAADVALITPLKDGMNLVAKEFCAASIEEESVLVLSEFAGAAAQLKRGAILVNPYDIEGVADTLYRISRMLKDERRARMSVLRQTIKDHDIFRWVDSFLQAALLADLTDFPARDVLDETAETP